MYVFMSRHQISGQNRGVQIVNKPFENAEFSLI
jgi:hypothetical protein